jgi:hypothetical protein
MIQTLRAAFDATGRLSLWRQPAGREEMSQPASRAPLQPRAGSDKRPGVRFPGVVIGQTPTPGHDEA